MCMKGDPKVSVLGSLRASAKKAYIESHKTKLVTLRNMRMRGGAYGRGDIIPFD